MMMLQLALSYLFAVGMGLLVVYLARRNRRQGWQRPVPTWFGVQLESNQVLESESVEVMGQLQQLNRELISHGVPRKPEMAPSTPATLEHASTSRL